MVFFLGQDCEIDVSVCNATESKCSNGGECIDGFGPAFHCNCPSGKREIVIFYTEILTEKVVLWCFFTCKTGEKIHNSTFLVKISV